MSCLMVLGVSHAVHFDHEPLLKADEVEIIARERRLPSEMKTLRT